MAVFADTYASLPLEASVEAARKVEAFFADQAEQDSKKAATSANGAVRRIGRPRS